jgi:hypothetical protein
MTSKFKDIEKELRNRIDSAMQEIDQINMQSDIKVFGQIDIVPRLEEVSGTANDLRKATDEARNEIAIELDKALTASVTAWGIVDTGALLRSQSVTVTGESIVITYGVPYAEFVHEGGYIRPYGNPNADTVYIQGRPWIDSVLYGGGPVSGVNLDERISQAILRRL